MRCSEHIICRQPHDDLRQFRPPLAAGIIYKRSQITHKLIPQNLLPHWLPLSRLYIPGNQATNHPTNQPTGANGSLRRVVVVIVEVPPKSAAAKC